MSPERAVDVATREHAHLWEWLEIDWGFYAWICACGEFMP